MNSAKNFIALCLSMKTTIWQCSPVFVGAECIISLALSYVAVLYYSTEF